MHTSCASSPGSAPEGLPGAKVTVLLGEGEEEQPVPCPPLSPSKPVPRVSRGQRAPLACSAEAMMVHCSLDTAAPRQPLGMGMETQRERGPETGESCGQRGVNFTLQPCVCVCVCVCVCLCDPCSPPGSSVHGTLQARILEWVAVYPFSRGSSPPRD